MPDTHVHTAFRQNENFKDAATGFGLGCFAGVLHLLVSWRLGPAWLLDTFKEQSDGLLAIAGIGFAIALLYFLMHLLNGYPEADAWTSRRLLLSALFFPLAAAFALGAAALWIGGVLFAAMMMGSFVQPALTAMIPGLQSWLPKDPGLTSVFVALSLIFAVAAARVPVARRENPDWPLYWLLFDAGRVGFVRVGMAAFFALAVGYHALLAWGLATGNWGLAGSIIFVIGCLTGMAVAYAFWRRAKRNRLLEKKTASSGGV